MVYGTCKYCGEYKKLCSAHIIPKSFYNLKENKNFIGLSNDGTKDLITCQNGFKDDSILCSDCDKKLGIYDKYAKEILYDKIPKCRRFNTPVFLMTDDQFDYQKMRFFFLSLLWRASISQKDACSQISLGSQYENIALNILKGNIADDDSLFHPFIFKRTPKYKFHNVAIMSKGKYSGQWKTTFTFPGYTVDIITNATPLKNQWVVNSFSLNSKELVILETDDDVTKTELPIWKIIENIQKNKT